MTPRKFSALLLVMVGAVVLPASAMAVPSIPGIPTVTSKPKSLTNGSQGVTHWTAGTGGTPTGYECRVFVAGILTANWESCTSPATVPSSKGNFTTLQIRAVNSQGQGPASTVSWKGQDLSFVSLGDIYTSPSSDLKNQNVEIGTLLRAGSISVTGSSGRGSISYQWLQCEGGITCDPISGAVSPTFRVTKAQAGYFIRVRVKYTSDTDFEGNNFVGSTSADSDWVQSAVAKIVTQPSISYSGDLNFGKMFQYSIGTFGGGFIPCRVDQGNQSECGGATAYTTLQYCATTDASTCVDSYNMSAGAWHNTTAQNAMAPLKANIRVLEPAAIGKHIRIKVWLFYGSYGDQTFYSPITAGTVAGPTSTAIPSININPSSYTSQYGTQTVPKRGRTISSTFGSWSNVYNWSYWVQGTHLYGFYETRPFVYWYRCSSATDTETCTPVNRRVEWRADGSGYLTYTPDSDDVGNYIRTRAAYGVCYSVGPYMGDCPSWWSDWSTATAKVIRN